MGFKNQELFNSNPVEDDLDQDISGEQIEERPNGAVSWAEWVDQLNNNLNPKVSSLYGNSGADIENPASYGPSISLPEMQPFRVKQKRYGSLKELQDKALTSLEKKKRDRAKRKKKNKFNELQDSELDGRSLSDSDIHARREALTKEARKTLALGKNLGMEIQGFEEEVIQEIVASEEVIKSKGRGVK
ncbi:hypothetical protein GQ457_10G003750 [Hibiscus cannabinus]